MQTLGHDGIRLCRVYDGHGFHVVKIQFIFLNFLHTENIDVICIFWSVKLKKLCFLVSYIVLYTVYFQGQPN